MKKVIVVLSLISATSVVEAATFTCGMNERFVKQLPRQVELEVKGKTANLYSNELGQCESFKELRGWMMEGGGGYSILTGAVNCAVGTVTLKIERLSKSKISLNLGGDEYSYPSIGEANYICVSK